MVVPEVIEIDRNNLLWLGERLDKPTKLKSYSTVRDLLMAALLKINNKEGRRVPFVTNEGQQRIAEHWGNKNVVLKARQLGISTYVAARFFIETVTRPGCLTVQVAHDQRSAEDLFRIVHRFQENLPESLREGVLKTSRSNVRQLRWPHLDSEYRVETAADPNAGRGMTIRNLHCSEVAMWPREGAEALLSLRAAVPPDGQVVLESTAKGAGGTFYEEWHSAGETGYVQHFLPWWVEKGYRRPGVELHNPTDEEIEFMRKHGLDEEQMVYRRELQRNCRGKMAQEYAEDAESCFLLSGDCVFDAESIDKRMQECEMTNAQNNAVETRDNGRELIFLPPRRNRDYLIAVDTASGSSTGDYACAQVIDKAEGRQCAELHGHFDTRETADRVLRLAKYYNNALVIVERNNHGAAVHDRLSDRYANTYENWTQKKSGWITTTSSKPAMIQFLGDLLVDRPQLFHSARFLRECRTFLRHEDGSSSAATGAHDDTVMAMAIAQYVRKETSGKHTRSSDYAEMTCNAEPEDELGVSINGSQLPGSGPYMTANLQSPVSGHQQFLQPG
jgi:hypothetical protein